MNEANEKTLQQVESLSKKAECLTDELNEKQQMISELQQKIVYLQGTLTEKCNELECNKLELEKVSKSLSKLEVNHAELAEEHDDKTHKMNECSIKLLNLEEQIQQTRKDNLEEVKVLSTKLQQHQAWKQSVKHRSQTG